MQPIVAMREQLFIVKGLQGCTRLYLMHSLRSVVTSMRFERSAADDEDMDPTCLDPRDGHQPVHYQK
nr:hypothetical protein [Tanacetum cinerariifolium]